MITKIQKHHERYSSASDFTGETPVMDRCLEIWALVLGIAIGCKVRYVDGGENNWFLNIVILGNFSATRWLPIPDIRYFVWKPQYTRCVSGREPTSMVPVLWPEVNDLKSVMPFIFRHTIILKLMLVSSLLKLYWCISVCYWSVLASSKRNTGREVYTKYGSSLQKNHHVYNWQFVPRIWWIWW